MKITNIEKASKYYGNLNDINEANIRNMKLCSIANIGGALLISTLGVIHAQSIGDATFSQVATNALLPLLSAYAGIRINASVNKMIQSEKNIKEYSEVSYLVTRGTEEEQRAFLQAKYPGLYDSIIHNYENSKGMSR